MTKESEDKAVAVCKQRITALEKYTQGIATITINGAPLTPAQVEAVYQGSLDTRTEVTNKHGEYRAAVAQRKQADAARKPIDQGLRGWVSNTFGAESQAMNDFGYARQSPHVRSAADKAKAVEKGIQTRKARHTMGKRQKSKVHGDAGAPAQPAATGKPPTPGA